MVKDWLIRTKNNHILGPVTKDKIRQLISNGSIKGDDEVCCGNGYWIFIREQDLVARYIFGEEDQDFNPVQEVDPVLALSQPSAEDLAYPGEEAPISEEDKDTDEFGNLMPDNDDLAYPDMDEVVESQTDATMIGNSLGDLVGQLNDGDSQEVVNVKEEALEESDQVKKKKPVPRKKNSKKAGVTKRTKIPQKKETEVKMREGKAQVQIKSGSKRFLMGLSVFLFVIVVLLLYFRKTLVKEIIETSSNILIQEVHAQADNPKKKSGLIIPS